MNSAVVPFLQGYTRSDLETASEFLSDWLPFLTKDLCNHCSNIISDRVRSLNPREYDTQESNPSDSKVYEADMAQEEDDRWQFRSSISSQVKETKATCKAQLTIGERERIRLNLVDRKKDFICEERVHGNTVNILDGLELHCKVFSVSEQKTIVDLVNLLQKKGENKELKERTFTAPRKWKPGKGRVTIQFGCCYNFATDKSGNLPGILRNEPVDPLPPLFKNMIKRLVQWHVLPPTCVPDSCIVNIYDEGDCIPPHIDSHHFLRPFCTVSFLSECNIVFGKNLKIDGAGEFSGAYKIPLPVGSVLVFNGNGADVAKHCVPAVPTKRISITFRKMDESKWPAKFVPEPDLKGLEPLADESVKPKPVFQGEPGLFGSQPRFYSQSQPVRRDETRDNSRRLLGSQPRFYSHSQPVRRDETRDNSRRLLGSKPRFYCQSQTRRQGPSSYNPKRTRLEY